MEQELKRQVEKGHFGPFRPPLRAQVPLWLALMMKQNNKCNIMPPDWLTPGIKPAQIPAGL